MGKEKISEIFFWWVAKSKARQEFKAERALIQQGFISYCPEFQKEIKRQNKYIYEPQPLFSGYVFIQANDFAKKNVHLIRSTRGIASLLKIGEAPASVLPEIIRSLKTNQLKEHDLTAPYYAPGNLVKITKGIYQDIEAIYQMDNGSDRAIVLISLIQKQTELIISKQHLIKN